PGDRRRRTLAAAHRAGSSAYGFDGVVGAARAGPGHSVPAPLGVGTTVPAAIDRDGPGSADPDGRGQHGRHQSACADRPYCSDGMPGADDPGLQIPYLPSVCADSVLLDVAGGKGRPDVDLRLPAAGDEAAELGRTPAAVAADVAGAR